MIVWREKFIATGVHFAVTLLLACIAASLIFLVWYPDPLQEIVGGTELFMLIVGSDLVLGPLMSLVLYDSRKSRRALLVDYTIVGIVQISALVYGVSIMADARPVYIAFSTDRLEIVLAGDIKPAELAAARDPRYARIPWGRPRYVAVKVPPEDHNDALFQALSGNESQTRPKFYVPYASQLDAIRRRARPLAELEEKKPAALPLIEKALAGTPAPRGELQWLPVHSFRGFWTAIIDDATCEVVAWVNFDPY